MTQAPRLYRAETNRREKEWMTALRLREEQLQAMPDRDLDALVAATVFNNPDLGSLSYCTSWDGFGHIVEQMTKEGYTLRCYSFEESHLDRMKQSPSTHDTRPAEVTVLDIRRRVSCPKTWPGLQVGADSLPRAAAIAAVLTHQMEQEPPTSSVSQPVPIAPKTGWSEERRRRHSEQMKNFWQRKHAADSAN